MGVEAKDPETQFARGSCGKDCLSWEGRWNCELCGPTDEGIDINEKTRVVLLHHALEESVWHRELISPLHPQAASPS